VVFLVFVHISIACDFFCVILWIGISGAEGEACHYINL